MIMAPVNMGREIPITLVVAAGFEEFRDWSNMRTDIVMRGERSFYTPRGHFRLVTELRDIVGYKQVKAIYVGDWHKHKEEPEILAIREAIIEATKK